MVEYLSIDRGADIHAKNRYNWTALHMAASNGKKDVVEYLIERGVDIHAKTNTD